MNIRGRAALLMINILVLTSFSVLPGHAGFLWSVQIIDGEGASLSDYCPIAVDSNNTVHIAYTAIFNGTYFIRYASSNGSSWTIQTIDKGYDAYSLLLDANGNPHVLYGNLHQSGDGLVNPLKIAVWNGINWGIQDTGISEGRYAELALDSSGNPHIAYTTGKAIKYASRVGTKWNIQTVDTSPDDSQDIPFRLSFVMDSNNIPYILYNPSSYIDNSQSVGVRALNVTLATYQNHKWDIQALPLSSPIGYYGNMVVDSKGYPHFIFTKPYFASSENMTLLRTLKYASWNGTTWNTETVVSDTFFDSISSLALDSNDYPHIFYVIPAPEGHVKTTYTSWTGSFWDSVDANVSIGGQYLVLDSKGNPHLSCNAESPARFIARIMYATATETTETPSPTLSTTPTQQPPSELTQSAVSTEPPNNQQPLPYSLIITVAVIIVVIAIVGLAVYFRKCRKIT